MFNTEQTKSADLRSGVVIPALPDEKRFHINRAEETQGLVEALDCECVFLREINVRRPNSATLIGGGQLEDIADQIHDLECDILVLDGTLTPIQQRNLERQLKCKVIDRTGLILEIFGLRARTRAGRLQVETARLAYERSRLVRTWTHLERQRGGRGFISGPGETQIEADRRMLDNTLHKLKRQLADVERTRRLHRSGRASREIPVIALVGYTNAGKSTLFNALSGSDVFAKDMPFATLDPTIRQIELSNGKAIALVDTVGFITDLPTALVESFKATLEESMEADIILHVHDASSEDYAEQEEDVLDILEDLEDITNRNCPPIINVWNKCDKIDSFQQQMLQHRADHEGPEEPHYFVSALNNSGLEDLKSAILEKLFEQSAVLTFHVGLDQGDALAWLHRNGNVISQEYSAEDQSTHVNVELLIEERERFKKAFPTILQEPDEDTELKRA